MTADGAPLMIALRAAADEPLETVGGKAHDLGTLLAAGFRVPDGFVIPAQVTASLAAAPELPDELVQRLGVNGAHAFRSSSPREDGADASFAGQYVSVLNVRGTLDAQAAIRRCCASARGHALEEYLRQVGGPNESLAVIVQEMVNADCAGVAFTANPMTGADELLIEATRGLGDALMDGRVEPERWSATPGERARRLSGPRVLDDAQVAEIQSVCAEIVDTRGTSQDVEWAFADDVLFILQSRPITALPIEPTERPPELQCWQRDDGHFPEPVLPLAASLWLPMHARCLERVAARAGIPMRTVHSEVFGGRVYSRVIPLDDPGRDDRALPPAWLLWLVVRLAPGFRRCIRAARVAVESDLPMSTIDAWENGRRELIRNRTTELRDVSVGDLDDERLVAHLNACARHLEEVGDAHFELIMCSTLPTIGVLGRLLARELGWTAAQVIDLLQGWGHASVGTALDELATAFAADPPALAMLRDSPHDLVSADSAAADALRTFLESYGHRLFSMAIDRPTWFERPALLADLIDARMDGSATRAEPRALSDAAERGLRNALAESAIWPAVADALHRARRARPYQDESEDVLFEALAPIRYAVLEGGSRLCDGGHLPSVSAVWLLRFEELLDALRGDPVAVDIKRRRGEMRWARANRLPATLGPPAQPPPDLSFPRDVDAYLGGIMWAVLADSATPNEVAGADLTGLGCSPGIGHGRVRIIHNPESLHELRAGEVLVCPGTTAAWSFAFGLLSGIVAETGGPLSHPATLAREYGVPAVLCVPDATTMLADGDWVRIDGTTGAIWRTDAPHNTNKEKPK